MDNGTDKKGGKEKELDDGNDVEEVIKIYPRSRLRREKRN